MKITTYKYEKVPVKDTELFIPEKPFYCFQTGVRRAIRIIPKRITWDNQPNVNRGDIYELNVTCIYGIFECKVEKFSVPLSQMEDHINYKETSKGANITRMLLEEDYLVRDEANFLSSLDTALTSFETK